MEPTTKNCPTQSQIEIADDGPIRTIVTRMERVGGDPMKSRVDNTANEYQSRLMSINTVQVGKQVGKIWQCGFCEKEFRFKYLLKRHIPTHTGARKFRCDECSKTYPQESSLFRHRLRVHPIKKKIDHEENEKLEEMIPIVANIAQELNNCGQVKTTIKSGQNKPEMVESYEGDIVDIIEPDALFTAETLPQHEDVHLDEDIIVLSSDYVCGENLQSEPAVKTQFESTETVPTINENSETDTDWFADIDPSLLTEFENIGDTFFDGVDLNLFDIDLPDINTNSTFDESDFPTS